MMRRLLCIWLVLCLFGPALAQDNPEGAFRSILLDLAGRVASQGVDGPGPWRDMLTPAQLERLRGLRLRPEQSAMLVATVSEFAPRLLDEKADPTALINDLQPRVLGILDPDQRAVLEEIDLSPQQLRDSVDWIRGMALEKELPSQARAISDDVLRKLQTSLPEGHTMLQEAIRVMLEKTGR